MSFESPAQSPLPQTDGDARALLARLYREIGVAAVAAALQAPAPSTPRHRPSVRDIPAVLRERDKAA